MTRLIYLLKSNSIALVALFVALGGTSYAAVSLPNDSVGTRQLRNGAVSQAKLASGLGGEVYATTQIATTGAVVSSTPRNVKVLNWQTGSSGVVNESGILVYPRAIPKACLPIAMANGILNPTGQDHLPGVSAVRSGRSEIELAADAPTYITVAIVCPR